MVDKNTHETGTGSVRWDVPAGFYTRTGYENKKGMIRGGAQVNSTRSSGTTMENAEIAQARPQHK
jgi:hypothetical protein